MILDMCPKISNKELLPRLQNSLLETAQRKFYSELSGDKNHVEPTTDAGMAKQFWDSI